MHVAMEVLKLQLKEQVMS